MPNELEVLDEGLKTLSRQFPYGTRLLRKILFEVNRWPN